MMKVISFAYIENGCNMEECYKRACNEVDETIFKLKKPVRDIDKGVTITELKSNFKKEFLRRP
jgi:hypothetical protein